MCSRLNQFANIPALSLAGNMLRIDRLKSKKDEDEKAEVQVINNICPTDYADVLTMQADSIGIEPMRFGLVPLGTKAHSRALLFIYADIPEALPRNLAALCVPLILNPRADRKRASPPSRTQRSFTSRQPPKSIELPLAAHGMSDCRDSLIDGEGISTQLPGASVSDASNTQLTAAEGHLTNMFGPLKAKPTFGSGIVMKRTPSTATEQFVDVPPAKPKNNSTF